MTHPNPTNQLWQEMSRETEMVIFSPAEQERILDCIYHALDPDWPRKGWPKSRKVRKEIADLYQKWGQFLGGEVKIPPSNSKPNQRSDDEKTN